MKALFPHIFLSGVSLDKMGRLITDSINDCKSKFPGTTPKIMSLDGSAHDAHQSAEVKEMRTPYFNMGIDSMCDYLAEKRYCLDTETVRKRLKKRVENQKMYKVHFIKGIRSHMSEWLITRSDAAWEKVKHHFKG